MFSSKNDTFISIFLVIFFMKKYNIIIVDDHEIFRNGLKFLLENIDNVNVVGQASNGSEFIELLVNSKVDIVFMDINMPVTNGVVATETAIKKYPQLKIIALTAFEDIENINNMIDAGVSGYMLKNSKTSDFLLAIQNVMNEESYFSPRILTMLSKIAMTNTKQSQPNIKLTEREKEVLNLICKGLSNKEIAEKLFISIKTVESHKTNLLSKTNKKNTVNLVIHAFNNGLI